LLGAEDAALLLFHERLSELTISGRGEDGFECVGSEVLRWQRERQPPVAFQDVTDVQQRQSDNRTALVIVNRVPEVWPCNGSLRGV
jgi:hypothetical protein